MSLFVFRGSVVLVAGLVALAIAGCAKNKETLIPGTWTGTNLSVTAKEDKTFTSKITTVAINGTWKIDGDDVVFTPTTVNGQPIANVKSALMAQAASNPQIKAFAEDIDKPNIMTISDDGKTLTTDKAKDKNSGPPTTLTKSP